MLGQQRQPEDAMTPEELPDLHELGDGVYRYLQASDRRDPALARTRFTTDAGLVVDGRQDLPLRDT